MARPANSATWTDEDFRVVFMFLRDIRAAMDNDECLNSCRDLLKAECVEASKRLARIADAVCASC